MEFEKLLELRQSTRKYIDRQLSDEQIARIVSAAEHAPVGSNQYKDVHITIVQDKSVILKMCEGAWNRFSSRERLEEVAGDTMTEESEKKRPNLFYDAPTVFFVSHRKQTLQPGIEWANVISLINQMHLEATNLGLGSCYMWGALESMRMLPEFDHTDLLELPEDFEPLCALAVGYPTKELDLRDKTNTISVNRI